MKNIPSNLTEVKDDWLRGLFADYDGFDAQLIKDIEKEKVGEGIGQVGQFCKLSVILTTGEKSSYFLKLRAPVEGMHQVALRYKMYENEVRFYQELAAELVIRTPKVVFADYDPETENVVLLMEFMDGWHSPDQVAGASDAQIRLAITEIPKISAPFWNRTSELTWVSTTKSEHMWSSSQDMKLSLIHISEPTRPY